MLMFGKHSSLGGLPGKLRDVRGSGGIAYMCCGFGRDGQVSVFGARISHFQAVAKETDDPLFPRISFIKH